MVVNKCINSNKNKILLLFIFLFQMGGLALVEKNQKIRHKKTRYKTGQKN